MRTIIRCNRREIFQKVCSSFSFSLSFVINALNRISLIEISRRLLSVLNYGVICSNLANLNTDTEENLSKKLNLFHQSILSSVPCSLPLELLLEQIEFKSRSHRH